MSGIAEVLHLRGHLISGSDQIESETVRRLQSLGIRVMIGHQAAHVQGVDVVVVSSAVSPSNPEWEEARRLRIPVLPRAEMLGEIMRGKIGIAVAGTHGKTTTTSMLGTVLTAAGMDPTLVIGGRVDALGGNAKSGASPYMVAEADESDGSFLHLPATFGIVTNIDDDHLEHFGGMDALDEAFLKFVGKLPYYGFASVCGEDPGIKRCLGRFSKAVKTYGWDASHDFSAKLISQEGLRSRFSVAQKKKNQAAVLGEVELCVPGGHNVMNALATIPVALMGLEVPFESIAKGLSHFRGVKRRFEIKAELNREDALKRMAVIDDYGHHPAEVQATLSAARAFWGKNRIVTVFQPHRYSRMQRCFESFIQSFQGSDACWIADIYPAGESPIEGIHSEKFVQELKKAFPQKECHYGGPLGQVYAKLVKFLRPGDLVLCMGAGSITKLADELAASLKAEFAKPRESFD